MTKSVRESQNFMPYEVENSSNLFTKSRDLVTFTGRWLKMILILYALFVLGLLYYLFSRQLLSSYPKSKRLRKPIASLTDDDCKYAVRNLQAPKSTGLMLKLIIKLLYTRFGKNLVFPYFMRKSGLMLFDGVVLPEYPTFIPLVNCEPSRAEEDVTSANVEEIDKLMKIDAKRSSDHSKPITVADYIQCYQSNKFTPLEVITATLKCVETHDKVLKSISQLDQQSVMKMASASTKRWQNNKPLSLLDGVPVVIKEELKVEPHILRNGCVFVPSAAQGIEEECTIATRLREAGAIILGVTRMQEMGFGILGSNPNHLNGTPRNPYNTNCYAGGSSTGSAIAVAAGFCPISIGCDGGGSVRVPAALCGVVGLKPTYARLTSHGCIPTAFTVSHMGTLCSSVTDTAILYNIIAHPDHNYPLTLNQPQLTLRNISNMMLSDITIGIYDEWFEDADTSVVLKCKEAVKTLEALGANVVNIKIPELEEVRVGHVISIASEICSIMAADVDEHFNDYNLETLLVAIGGYSTTGVQYVTAQKQRTRAIESLKKIFKQIDCIVTPASGCVAPKIPEEALTRGEGDATTSGILMKYAPLGNFTGIPGVVVPVGYDKEGLPISLQIMGRWWEEHVILRVAYAVENGIEYKPPVVHCNPLVHD